MGRIDYIAQVVRRNIKDEGAINVSREDLLFQLGNVQFDVSERAFGLKRRIPITLEKGRGSYRLGEDVFRIAGLTNARSWKATPRIFSDPGSWAEFESTGTLASQPLGIFVWNGEFIISPAPAISEEIIVYAYARTGRALKYGGDPELDRRHDECLIVGLTARLMKYPKIKEIVKSDRDWDGEYEAAIMVLGSMNNTETLQPQIVGSRIGDEF